MATVKVIKGLVVQIWTVRNNLTEVQYELITMVYSYMHLRYLWISKFFSARNVIVLAVLPQGSGRELLEGHPTCLSLQEPSSAVSTIY